MMEYGVASVSRIDKFIGLFCKRALQRRRYSAEETYNLIDPTNRSHAVSRPHLKHADLGLTSNMLISVSPQTSRSLLKHACLIQTKEPSNHPSVSQCVAVGYLGVACVARGYWGVGLCCSSLHCVAVVCILRTQMQCS